MSVAEFYSPWRQFRRALSRDWRLHSLDLLCGMLYPVIGFYVGRRVGQSQVHSVIAPFLVTAVFLIYLTRRLCLPEVKRESAFSYFNLPQGRLMPLDAHMAFLAITALWLTACVFAGSLLKLGGAGMTACYRLHPDFVVLPCVAIGLAIRHVYLVRDPVFWVKSLVWYALLLSWIVWRSFGIATLPLHSGNNYWPERGVSLQVEWIAAAVMAAVAAWWICRARIQWRMRQIGGIR